MSTIQTSTPIILPKPSSQSSRTSWLNQDITQQLYRNTWAKFKSPKSAHWDSIEGPNFVDFNDQPAEPRDSFFDGKQPDCPSPQKKQDMTLPNADEPMEIVQCLKACSISSIGNFNSDHEDDTLLSDDSREGDDTLRPPEISSEISKSDRRQSQLVVKPFSFELREKENQERRESRRAYYKMLTEKMTPQSFKAKPVPKFIQRLSLAGKSELTTETPHRRVVRVPRKETAESNPSKVYEKCDKSKGPLQIPKSMKTTTNPFQIQQKAKSVVNPVQSQSIKTGRTNPFQLQQKSKSAGNPFQLQKIKNSASIAQPAKIQKPSGNLNTEAQGNKSTVNVFQIKKPKPFQLILPHRKIELPKSPELLTARRARERQAFEEKIKERELQREEMKKKAEAAQKAKEQEEIARLRKMTVFKARPVPQYVTQVAKRPLTDPMIPIFTKRRRCL